MDNKHREVAHDHLLIKKYKSAIYYFIPSRMSKIKRQERRSVDEDIEKLEPS